MSLSMHFAAKATALLFSAILLMACGRSGNPAPPSHAAKQDNFGIPPDAKIVHTAHYKIYSTATGEQTEKVSTAVEALYGAYVSQFGSKVLGERLELVLYKDQEQFRANNRSKPWAEAYYRTPRCYAYFAESDNPYHWMIHEATHQLLREFSDYQPAKWVNEGVASYFGASKVAGSVLQPGSIDPAAYPIWWLSSFDLSGSLERDIGSGKIIPLRQLITDTGPDINLHVNLYYIHYWSLSHFLFHYRDGHYAARFKELVKLGGSLGDFERLIGPVDKVQSEWYGYLMQQAQSAGGGGVQVGP